jgi:hypothetical protein
MKIFQSIHEKIFTIYLKYGDLIIGLEFTYLVVFAALIRYGISLDGMRVMLQNYIIVLSAILAASSVTISLNKQVTREIVKEDSSLLFFTLFGSLGGIFFSLVGLLLTYTSAYADSNLIVEFSIATFIAMIPLWTIVTLTNRYVHILTDL